MKIEKLSNIEKDKKTIVYSEDDFDPLNKDCYNPKLLYIIEILWKGERGKKLKNSK